MTKLLIAVLPGGLVVLALLWLWRRRSTALVMSHAWLDARARADERAGAPWVGVCWRVYDPVRDRNGRLNRWIEHTRAIAARRVA